MRFGVAAFVTDEGIRPGPLGAALEERGFSTLVVSEHSHIPVRPRVPYPEGGLPRDFYRTFDPFLVLAAAAAATERLTLATGVVLLPQRDVLHTAKEVATLDRISDGRVAFGVGVGWNRDETRNHGTDPAVRGARVNEQLAALKQIWTREQPEFHGDHIDFDPIFSWPEPVQRPHPPIYVGGESPSALERLRVHGDGWMPQAATSPSELRRVRSWLADNGRPDVPTMIWGAGRDEATLAGYGEAGVDEVTFLLPAAPPAQTLHDLDELAVLADRLS